MSKACIQDTRIAKLQLEGRAELEAVRCGLGMLARRRRETNGVDDELYQVARRISGTINCAFRYRHEPEGRWIQECG